MKKIEIAKAIGLADENFVAEAAPKATTTKSVFWRKFAIIAACVSLVVTSMCLWLFLPYDRAEELPDIADEKNLPAALEEYAGSEYLDLMYAIYRYDKTHTSKPNNNFENYIKSFIEGAFGYFAPKNGGSSINIDLNSDPTFDASVFVPDSIVEAESSTTVYPIYSANTFVSGNYVETTDNQVKGVTEADLFKRTKTHIFYLDKSSQTLRVYSIAGEESRQVAELSLNYKKSDMLSDFSGKEMFLSQDGKTLTILCRTWERKYSWAAEYFYRDSCALLISLDVSDPKNIKESSRFAIKGSYTSARVVDGKILLFSNYNMNNYPDHDYSDISTFVPSIDCGNGFTPIPADSIIFPDEITSKYYTIVTRLNESDLAFEGSIACLSYSDTVYVSADKIFVTRSYNDYVKREKDGEKFVDNANMTEITAISYRGESFEKLGSIRVAGRLKNQYSLDEFEGILRVVTTTGGTRYIGDKYLVTEDGLYYGNSNNKPARSESIATNAALYCIDLSTFEIVGEVRDFAPAGETVESVRFDGTNAYVCTAVVVTFTDPVYFFDLSDMNNITYTDTGDIEGYSSSLVNFGDGLLLGIGYGENSSILKIEVYAEEGDRVISLASYEVEGVSFSTDYKSYFIDRERGLVGLMFDEWRIGYGCRYVLLDFDGYQLFEVVNQKFDVSFQPQYARATIADDYFYMMVSYEFKAIKLFD